MKTEMSQKLGPDFKTIILFEYFIEDNVYGRHKRATREDDLHEAFSICSQDGELTELLGWDQ